MNKLNVRREGKTLIGSREVNLCCEKMAEEIYLHPYENYVYISDDKGGILGLRFKATNGAWQPLNKCPFCGWKAS